MIHVIRMNVGGRGYTLYSGGSSAPYRDHPLDIQSLGIPDNYISAQKRIDGLLSGSLYRPYICISNLGESSSPLVVYGCNFPIEDEYGRPGLSFVHAIQDNSFSSTEIVMSIARFMNPSTMDKISECLSSVAQGHVEPEMFFRLVANSFSSTQRIFKQSLNGPAVPIRSITHDCVGTAVAWAAMAASHRTTAPPWEIYDEHSNQEGFLSTISTISTAPSARKNCRLSEFIGDVICGNVPVESASSDKKSTSQAPPKPTPEQPASPAPPSPHDAMSLPRLGRIVVLDSKHGQKNDQLRLTEESEFYLVTPRNCIEIGEFPSFYRLKIYRSYWKLLVRQKCVQLVIFKADLSPEDKVCISRFLEFFKKTCAAPKVKVPVSGVPDTSPKSDTKEAEDPTHAGGRDRETPKRQQGSKSGAGPHFPPIRGDLVIPAKVIILTGVLMVFMIVIVGMIILL